MNNSKTNLEILIDILSTNYIQIEEPLEEYIREFASYLSEIESRKNDKDNWLAAQNIIAKQALLGHYNNSEEKYPSNMTNEIEFIIENSDFVQILNSSNPILISEEKNSELQAKCKAINLTYVTGYQALKLLDAEDTRYHSGKSKKHLVKIIDTTITKTVTKHDLYKKIKNYLTNKKRILFVLNESNEKLTNNIEIKFPDYTINSFGIQEATKAVNSLNYDLIVLDFTHKKNDLQEFREAMKKKDTPIIGKFSSNHSEGMYIAMTRFGNNLSNWIFDSYTSLEETIEEVLNHDVQSIKLEEKNRRLQKENTQLKKGAKVEYSLTTINHYYTQKSFSEEERNDLFNALNCVDQNKRDIKDYFKHYKKGNIIKKYLTMILDECKEGAMFYGKIEIKKFYSKKELETTVKQLKIMIEEMNVPKLYIPDTTLWDDKKGYGFLLSEKIQGPDLLEVFKGIDNSDRHQEFKKKTMEIIIDDLLNYQNIFKTANLDIKSESTENVIQYYKDNLTKFYENVSKYTDINLGESEKELFHTSLAIFDKIIKNKNNLETIRDLTLKNVCINCGDFNANTEDVINSVIEQNSISVEKIKQNLFHFDSVSKNGQFLEDVYHLVDTLDLHLNIDEKEKIIDYVCQETDRKDYAQDTHKFLTGVYKDLRKSDLFLNIYGRKKENRMKQTIKLLKYETRRKSLAIEELKESKEYYIKNMKHLQECSIQYLDKIITSYEENIYSSSKEVTTKDNQLQDLKKLHSIMNPINDKGLTDGFAKSLLLFRKSINDQDLLYLTDLYSLKSVITKISEFKEVNYNVKKAK